MKLYDTSCEIMQCKTVTGEDKEKSGEMVKYTDYTVSYTL